MLTVANISNIALLVLGYGFACKLLIFKLPEAGLEPAQCYAPRDFKCVFYHLKQAIGATGSKKNSLLVLWENYGVVCRNGRLPFFV